MPLALYVLALAVFAMGTSEFMLAGLVPDIAADLGVPVSTAGLLTSAFAAGMVIGAPAMAAVTRRLPSRATLLGCVVLFALLHMMGAITPDFTVLVVIRVLAAFTNAGFLAIALGTATKMVAADRKGHAVAALLSGTTAATVVGVPAGALLGAALGWRSTFWAIALLCIPAAVGIARCFANLADEASPEGSVAPPLLSELAQLTSPRLAVTMLLAALVNAGTFGVLTFLAPIVTDTAGLTQWWVSVALMLFGIGSLLGVAIAGRFADRRPQLLVAAAGGLLLVGWIALAVVAANPVVLLLLVLVQGILGFAVGTTLITRTLYAAADAPTMGGSYATAALNVGAAVGPVLAAASLDTKTGDLGPAWVAASTTGAALLLALPLLRTVASRPPLP